MKRTGKITAFFKKHKKSTDDDVSNVETEDNLSSKETELPQTVAIPTRSTQSRDGAGFEIEQEENLQVAEAGLWLQDTGSTETVKTGGDAMVSTPSTSGSSSSSSSSHLIIKDVGLYLDKKPDDFTKVMLLEDHWKPPANYTYPFSVNSKGVKRYLSKNHLEKHCSWLVLSESKKGLLCKYCSLFSQEKAGHNKGVKLGKLVVQPLTKFKDLTGKDGDLQSHEQSLYHKQCVEAGKLFLKTYKSPQKEVINQMSSERLRQITENRERLKPIIKSIIFLGRQNIPFRGHRDDGRISTEMSVINQGNFKALLQFRVEAGDKILEDHLKKSSSRATYVSKTTQNILIECCGDEIREEILRRVHEAEYWSVMFDETTDLSHKAQITLVVRYFWQGTVREDFITFIDAYKSAADLNGRDLKENKLSGKVLGEIVVQNMKNLGLDLSRCVGIGTDGASVMTSEDVGSVQHIQREAVNAKRLPCYNHALNNSISKSNKIQSIKNAIGIMKEVIHFYNQSSKRNEIMSSHLGGKLVSLCETRWVERHDAVILFYCSLPEIVDSFTEISGWKESESAKKATLYINSITSTEFIFSCVCLIDILKITLPLSKLLQKPNLDLNTASSAVKDTLACLKERRDKCEDYFKEIYLEAIATSDKLGVELKMPRVVKIQRNRENHEATTVLEYYRKSMYIPLLDHVIVDLQDRFKEENLMCFDLNLLIPSHITTARTDSEKKDLTNRIRKLVKAYNRLLPVAAPETVVDGEVSLWKAKWIREAEEGNLTIPVAVTEVLQHCDGDIYPSVRRLLQILVTLPVSVASAERSFSNLNLVKSWLRTRMVEDRMNGLCLLYIHRDIDITVEKVLERYAKGGKRRLQLEVLV